MAATADNLVTIDGALGEGGGQIVRTAVGLAAALGRPVRVENIRARRSEPGLRPQHVAAVRAAAAVSSAKLEGDSVGSRALTFVPGELIPGRYRFDIGTAGSTVLVLQTVLPALVYAQGESEVVVTGGTHNPHAPCLEYLRDVFGVLASGCGLELYFEMKRAGFYPAGGGEVLMAVRGVDAIDDVRPVRMSTRGELLRIEGLSAASSSLKRMIVERQAGRVAERLREAGYPVAVAQESWDTLSPGTAMFLRAVFSRSVAGFSALGAIAKPSEHVADEAVNAALTFLDSAGAVDSHAADQLLTPAAISLGESLYVAPRTTEHLCTNAAVVRQITGREVEIVESAPGGPATVRVHRAE